MYKKTIIITIVYKKNISNNELLSIESTKKYLKNYEKVIVAPKKFLSDKDFNKVWKNFGYNIIYFDNKYFESIEAYNKFMISIHFYKEFINYEYMLICQLDVLILSDKLENWLSKKFDYIGAPWILEEKDGLRFNYAGNGGLSLRRVKSFLNVLESKHFYYKNKTYNTIPLTAGLNNIVLIKLFLRYKFLKKFTPLFKYIYKGHEDIFWSFYADFFLKEFNVANAEESLAFSFECYPEFCYEKNNLKLPFGVHAWEKYNPTFWKEKVPEFFDNMNIIIQRREKKAKSQINNIENNTH